MRTKITRLASVFAIIFPAALSSCQEHATPMVKVPDFATLSSQFAEPPKEYTTAPFFVWNSDINENEIF